MNRKRNWTLRVGMLAILLVAGCSRQSYVERQLGRGNAFFERERYAEAIVCYISVLQRAPEHQEAIRQLGLSYYRTDDLGQSFPFLLQALRNEPERTDLKTKLALLFLAGGAPDDARELAEEVLNAEPDNLEALVLLADASTTPELIDEGLERLAEMQDTHAAESRYHLARGALNLRKGNLALAQEALAEAIRLAPDTPDGYVVRGMMYHTLTGDQEAARRDLEMAYSLAPTVSLAGLRYATFFRNLGELDKARQILHAMIEASPEFLPALYERAALDAAEQRFEDSLEGISKTLAIQPGHVPSRLLRARIDFLTGSIDEAEAMIEALVGENPMLPRVHVERARIQLRRGARARAEASLREALRLAPGQPEATVALAELEIRAGRNRDAIRLLQPIVATPSPARGTALLLLGAALRGEEQWAAALRVYTTLERMLPHSPEPPFLMGVTLQAAGELEEAEQKYQQALDLAPGYLSAVGSLVALDAARDDLEKAMQRVDREIERAPNHAGLQYLRASIAAQRNDMTEAEAALLRAVELNPRFSAAYQDLGRLYVMQGRTEEAIDRFSEAVRINPRDAAAVMMMSVLLEQEGRMEEVEAAYESLLRIDPNFAPALNNLAYLYARQNRNLDHAFELAQRAREQMPNDPAVADTLGYVALKRGDARWALSLLEESAAQLPGEPEVLHHLAQARQALGMEASAAEALRRALDMERDFPGRDEARALLGLLEIPLRNIQPESAVRLEAALRTMPENPSVLVRLAQYRKEQGQPEEAARLFEEALARSDRFVPALLGLARLHEDDGARAIPYARRAREVAPTDPETIRVLGWAAYRAGDFAWSRSLLAEAAELRPGDGKLLFQLAQSSLMVGRVEESHREARQAAEAFGEEGMARSVEGFLGLLNAYQTGLAESDLEVARQVLAELAGSAPLMELVDARLASGPQALAAYEALVARYPAWPLPARDLVALRVQQGTVDEQTLRLAQMARDRLPNDPVAARSLGLAMAQQGRYAPAIPLLRSAAERDASDGLTRFWLARAMHQRNEVAEAVVWMEAALETGLSDRLKDEAARLLEQWKDGN